ncbi:zinc-ribbon and DUF3426 domain-containing protein [Thiolapillus sp.]
MKVRCPHCKVIYNIKSATLAEADYKVVCSECHDVFDVKSSSPSPASEASRTAEDPQPDAEMQDLLAELQHSLDQQNTKQRNPPTRDQEEQQAGNLSSPDTLFGEEEQDSFLLTPPDTREEDLLPQPPRKKPTSLFTVVALLALLLAALAQVSWINKERLLQFPQIHTAATWLCSRFDCSLPPAQAEEQRFLVVDRTLQPADEQPGAYRLEVLLRNAGATTSPLPALRLSLLDDTQTTIARRTFPPGDYITDDESQPGELAAGKLLEIQLLILPPQTHFSGYRLDFIPAESS